MNWTRNFGLAAVVLSAGLLGGCGGGGVELQGVGATFPEPLYKKWFSDYGKKHSDVTVNYQGQGSGAGKNQFAKGTVTFGASDAAMTDDEIAKLKGEVLMLPMTAGSIVVAYNVPGVPDLKLSREAFVGIFSGKITKWNHPEIAKANPTAKLPDKDISVVHRSDGSGTTYVFTQHLSAISPEWKKGPGFGTTVKWPEGKFTGAKGNAGIAAQVSQNEGSVGYVEYGFATKSDKPLPMAVLQNKAGKFVAASTDSGKAALEGGKLPENLRLFIEDPESDGAYPIVTYTWILTKKKYDDSKVAAKLKEVLRYCLTDGQKDAELLGYIPLPKAVSDQVLKAVEMIQ